MTKARSVEVGNALAPAGNWPQRKRSGVWLTDENGNVATVLIPDVDQSNGVIHVIDTVLLPKM